MYRCKKNGTDWEVVEEKTGYVIYSDADKRKAQVRLNDFKNGKGFRGDTPAFLLGYARIGRNNT